MKLTFFGAAHAVTGSCHCLEVNGRKLLIDCGLQQGQDEHDDNALDFAPGYIDYVLVTHAHIDHTGRLPLLAKQGFNGRILTTRLTGQLMSIRGMPSGKTRRASAPACPRWSLSTLWTMPRLSSSRWTPANMARWWTCARGSGCASTTRAICWALRRSSCGVRKTA